MNVFPAMFDIKFIRENCKTVEQGLAAKGESIDLTSVVKDDQERRDLLSELEQLRTEKNSANDEISKLLAEKKDTKKKIASMKTISSQIDVLEPKLKTIQGRIKEVLIGIPNLPHESVPVGGMDQNKDVRSWGEPKQFKFKPKTHVQIAEALDIIDFKRGAKIAGSNFVLFKNEGARLERALYNFMLDVHTGEHGYREVFPPFLVNRDAMTGTGQLPKMEDDMYRLAEEDLFLIPTAEVPVTNIHRDEILKEEELPIYYTAYTACFRREAGSYGKDTRGLVRGT